MIALTGALSVFNSLVTNWKLVLIGAVALGLTFTTFEWRHTATLLKTEKVAHATDIASYKAAQTEAEAKVTAEKTAIIQENTEKANEADANYASLLATYHANLMRGKANQGVRGGPSSGQPPYTSQGSNGPGTSTDIPFTISTDDANICAINTARLQSAHDWALTLGDDTNGKVPTH